MVHFVLLTFLYLEKTVNSLDKLKTASQRSHFRKDKHKIFKSAVTKILNLPHVAETCSTLQFDLCEFEEEDFISFLDGLMAEVKEALSQIYLWLSFIVFDPRRLPEDQNLLVSYGDDEMKNF